MKLKRKLELAARQAKFATRATSGDQPFTVLDRIAIEALEARFFGDSVAVVASFPWVDRRILQRAVDFRGGLQKVAAARAIADHVVPARNTSPSFRALRTELEGMAT